jgi:threonine/homoserine/homoserine lactone efflux protein
MGFLAAAPIGPVNMMAIRRGIIGKWTHTLACGAGSAFADLLVFSLVLGLLFLGGHWIAPLSSSGFKRGMAIAGMVALVPMGVYFVIHSFRQPLREFARARRQMQSNPPKHLMADVIAGITLTLTNPLCIFYWLTATTNWKANAQSGLICPWWGLLMVGAGLMSWFIILTFLVRFMPNQIGPKFFRTVNFICGVMLVAFGAYCSLVAFGLIPVPQ